MRSDKKGVEDGEEEGGSEGKSGAIDFHYSDPSLAQTRDDLLEPTDIKKKLDEKDRRHKGHVTHEKEIRKDRKKLKEQGSVQQQGNSFGSESGMGMASEFEKHPISDKFNGMSEIDIFPADYKEKTNTDEQKEKQEEHFKNRLQNVPRNTPTFRPPRPY